MRSPENVAPAMKPSPPKRSGNGRSVWTANTRRGTKPTANRAAAAVNPVPSAPGMRRSRFRMIASSPRADGPAASRTSQTAQVSARRVSWDERDVCPQGAPHLLVGVLRQHPGILQAAPRPVPTVECLVTVVGLRSGSDSASERNLLIAREVDVPGSATQFAKHVALLEIDCAAVGVPTGAAQPGRARERQQRVRLDTHSIQPMLSRQRQLKYRA